MTGWCCRSPCKLSRAGCGRFGGQLRVRRLGPNATRAVGHVDAALGQQLHDSRDGQRVAQVPAHRHQDHVGRPAVARECRGGVDREVSTATRAVEPLAPVAVVAVTRNDDLLAVRTRGHAPDASSTSQRRKLMFRPKGCRQRPRVRHGARGTFHTTDADTASPLRLRSRQSHRRDALSNSRGRACVVRPFSGRCCSARSPRVRPCPWCPRTTGRGPPSA